MEDKIDLLEEKGAIPAGKDYNNLKELLDAGKKVIVKVQILPPGYDKYEYIAHCGEYCGCKYYDIGYGIVYSDEAFFRQCNSLDLEIVEPVNEDIVTTKPYIKVEMPTVGKKNGHIRLIVENLTYQQANVIRKMVHTWD